MARRSRRSSQFSYSNVPMLKYSRSMFDLSHKCLTSMNVGDLVPVFLEEVYPGDTFKITGNCVCRTSSPLIRPVMDNLFLDVYYFYVPNRIIYDNFVNVMGENTSSAWANTVEYTIPQIANGSVSSKTVGDYLGLPVGLTLGQPSNQYQVSVLPFRAFAKIWDDWFRDENNVLPLHLQTGNYVSSEGLNNNAWSPNNYTGKLPKVAKFHDMFTSALPAPQKGDAVPLSVQGDVPVITKATNNDISAFSTPLKFRPIGGGSIPSTNAENIALNGDGTFARLEYTTDPNVVISGTTYPLNYTWSPNMSAPVPVNLYAQTSGLSATTVNDLRLAFQLQKMLERDARGGTRFVEYLMSHWGVVSPDGRLQRSEFLGGKRTPLNINQVTQTTGTTTTDTNELGQLGAQSLTYARARATKGFVEHGFVIGVACVRQFHTYQQGMRKLWNHRIKRTDFYDPVFANIGEQPVWATELYAGTASTVGKDRVFGYQEAWVELRKSPNMITGQMRTGVENSLDIWHLGDNYGNVPVLGADFIEETPIYLDRSLTVSHEVQDQFICDFYFENIAYRRLPTYSVPSLIDHN